MSDNYITPIWLTDALGRFDLDPCCAEGQPWNHARQGYLLSRREDGLQMPWYGRVFLNCPYSAPSMWMGRAAHAGNGIAIVNVATSTGWWHDSVWGSATAVRFLDKRVRFYVENASGKWVEGKSPRYENALVAYGWRNALALARLDKVGDLRLAGQMVYLWRNWVRRAQYDTAQKVQH